MTTEYSVLMSIYKKTTVDELTKSVDSMLSQSVLPEQYVIVCDGPVSDELVTTLDDYCRLNPTIFTIVKLEQNHGLAFALNEGLKHCRNELVARMDSDDISLPSRCEKQLRAFDLDKELILLGTSTLDFEDVPENARPSVSYYPSDMEEIRKTLRRNDPFAHPTMMYKKSFVLQCGGYDEKLRRRQDYDLFSKMVNCGCKASNLAEPLLLYKVDKDNYARIKSKESCQSRIYVQKQIYQRGECSFGDYLYICVAMRASRMMPIGLYKILYKVVKNRLKK